MRKLLRTSAGAAVALAGALGWTLATAPPGAAATFDLKFYRYCAANSFCGLGSEANFQRRICDSVQAMNLIWEPTGISFRPVVLPIDSVSPAAGVPGAPPDKNQYFELDGCRGTDEDRALRVHWRDHVAVLDTQALSFNITQGQDRCCSTIARTSKPSPQLGLYCDANRSARDSGSLWAHELGHHWGLVHTHSGCRDAADGNVGHPVNNPDARQVWTCNDQPDDINSSIGCSPGDDAYCQSIGAGSCEKDLLPLVEDTPADVCGFEVCGRVCSNDVDASCSTDAQCPGGQCVCEGGDDEDFDGDLVDDHWWLATVGSERDIDPVSGVTDQGSPHDTFCPARVQLHANGATGPALVDGTVVIRNAMSYHGSRCKGPFVIDGVRYDAFTPDQLARIALARSQIAERAALVDVCAHRGGDSDRDGICDQDDICPHRRNTCQRLDDGDGDGIPDDCDLCPDDPEPTGDLDGDGIGDRCDTDIDNDGCLNEDDEHPEQSTQVVGSYFSPGCGVHLQTIYGFAGDDTDGDGVPNCSDPDDDNDEICDGDEALPPGTWGAADGCGPGPDFCPVDDGALGCHFQGSPKLCPPVWADCIGGGCFELEIRFSNVINPDPTAVLTFDRFEIYNETFYVHAQPGRLASRGAAAVKSLAEGAFEGAGTAGLRTPAPAPEPRTAGARTGGAGLVRMELWSKVTGERVAVVGEFRADQIRLGDLSRGRILRITPRRDARDLETLEIRTVHTAGLGPGDSLPDQDGDRSPDAVDNCIRVPNPAQTDTDDDGFGNACDPDLDGDGRVTHRDLFALRLCAGADLTLHQPVLEPELDDSGDRLREVDPAIPPERDLQRAAACRSADLDGDGRVGRPDLAVASRRFGGRPGPSAGVSSAIVDPQIRVGRATPRPGSEASFSVALDTGGNKLLAIEHELGFEPRLAIAADESGRPACRVARRAAETPARFSFRPKGCRPGSDCVAIHVELGRRDGTRLLESSRPLYACRVATPAPSDARLGFALACSGAVATGARGERLPADCLDGSIELVR